MPVHDWNLVEAGIFHGFHTFWIGELNRALNQGLLPSGYYALPEQHMGENVADILTLHSSSEIGENAPGAPSGALALAEAPVQTRVRHSVPNLADLRRTIAIRHVSGHQLIALIEIVSPSNKDRPRSVEQFVNKALEAFDHGIHLLLIDLFPPGLHDPGGLHAMILRRIEPSGRAYEIPAGDPQTLASYAVGPRIEMFVEHITVGERMPDMPVFLSHEHYVKVPLESTYDAAYRVMPQFWRDVLEDRAQA